ncbi:MAG: hypothetical protein QXI19_01760 [Candidatus Caldarchaeum sp.]
MSDQESPVPFSGTFPEPKFDEAFLERLLGPPCLDDNPLFLVEIDEYSVVENARLAVGTSVVPEPSTFLVIGWCAVFLALKGRLGKGK